ncbi:MAG: hypothetical protein Q8R25_01085 [bacterium]|nr:hypothetical protein [bacterium]
MRAKIAILTMALLAAVPAAAQTISSASSPEYAGCMNRFEAPKGTVSYEDFVRNDLGRYLESSMARGEERYNPAWGRYDEKANEFRNNPIVAFKLSGFFAFQFGSLQHGRKDHVVYGIHANDCHDLVLRQSDGKERAIPHVSAHLEWPEGSVELKHAGVTLDIYGKRFLEVLASFDKEVIVITRAIGSSWRMHGDRIQFVAATFQILDHKFSEK